jgi:hypothetical protein
MHAPHLIHFFKSIEGIFFASPATAFTGHTGMQVPQAVQILLSIE